MRDGLKVISINVSLNLSRRMSLFFFIYKFRFKQRICKKRKQKPLNTFIYIWILHCHFILWIIWEIEEFFIVRTYLHTHMCSYHSDLGRAYQVGATQREEAILADLYHPLHAEFRPLPSEGRYTFPWRANSNRNSRSFLPLAVFFF